MGEKDEQLLCTAMISKKVKAEQVMDRRYGGVKR